MCAPSEVSCVALRMSGNVIGYIAVKERGILKQSMFYLLLTWGGMWNNVSTWLTSRRASMGGAGASIVLRLIGSIQIHWQGENGKCEEN